MVIDYEVLGSSTCICRIYLCERRGNVSLFHQLLKSVQNSHSVKNEQVEPDGVVGTQLAAILMDPITPTWVQ